MIADSRNMLLLETIESPLFCRLHKTPQNRVRIFSLWRWEHGR